MKSYLDRLLTFLASACSEEDGSRSSRRLVMVAAIFAAIFFAAGLLIKHPDMSVDLIKFVVLNAIGVYFGTKVTELIKGPPGPPAVPAA
jgi:hypothetical protein